MDETYAEDSFVVGNEVEELESSEEQAEDVELMPEDSFVDGKRQYATRRRVFLHKARARAGSKAAAEAPPEQRAGVKAKRSRVIEMIDSSDEETEDVSNKRSMITRGGAVPLWPEAEQSEPSSSSTASKVSLLSEAQKCSLVEDQQNERYKGILKQQHTNTSSTTKAALSSTCRCRQRLENQHMLSDELDFAESELLLTSKKQPQVGINNTTLTSTVVKSKIRVQ